MFLQVSVCLGGVSVSVQGGSLSRGVSVQRGLCPRGSLLQTPPRTVTSGRYASYWNAFLFDLMSETIIFAFTRSASHLVCGRAIFIWEEQFMLPTIIPADPWKTVSTYAHSITGSFQLRRYLFIIMAYLHCRIRTPKPNGYIELNRSFHTARSQIKILILTANYRSGIGIQVLTPVRLPQCIWAIKFSTSK